MVVSFSGQGQYDEMQEEYPEVSMTPTVASTPSRSKRRCERQRQYAVLAAGAPLMRLMVASSSDEQAADAAFVPARTVRPHTAAEQYWTVSSLQRAAQPPVAAATAATPAASVAGVGLSASALAVLPTVVGRFIATAKAVRRCRKAQISRAAAEGKDLKESVTVEELRAEQAEDEEISGDDPLIKELEERLRKQNGNDELTLDMVLNPATIVNAERDVILLKAELKSTPEDEREKRKELKEKIETKQMKIVTEMRQVMTDSLKLEFIIQAVLSVPIFAACVYGTWPWVPDLKWLGFKPAFTNLMLQLFGVWGPWMVTIPALRARKPGGAYGMGYEEKRALDIAFLVLPFVIFGAPFFVKDPIVIFWGTLLITVACYAWSFSVVETWDETDGEGNKVQRRGVEWQEGLPEPLQFVLKAIDFGSASEGGTAMGIGTRLEGDAEWDAQLESYDKAAEELLAKQAARKAEDKAKGVEAKEKGAEESKKEPQATK